MVIPKAGDVVVLPFPFFDLSENKVRPAGSPAAALKRHNIAVALVSHERDARVRS